MSSLPTLTGQARVGIIGLGLMGGSLARALKRLPNPPVILGASIESDDRKRALDSGAVDEAHTDAVNVAASCDLLVYATPLRATLTLFESHRELWGSGTVITDVASLKAPLDDLVQEERFASLGIHERYVGSHPMVGRAESSFRASDAALYDEARVYLVRAGATDRSADIVHALWQTIGAEPQWTEAEEHDHRMAWCSQLPQLVSNALAGALEIEGFDMDDLGPGGSDMVRLAGSHPLMWRDIFASSGSDVAPALRSVARALTSISDLLEGGDADAVAKFMDRTRLWMRQGSLSPLAPPADSVGVVAPRPPAATRDES